ERAYPISSSAREKAFKRDRENLRKRLGVDFSYSASLGTYSLLEAGPLLKLQLSETSLRAIYLLSQSFDGHVGEHSNIQAFLNEIFSYLSAETKVKLEAPEMHMNLDLLQDIDSNHIPKRVWDMVQKSVKGHRKLTFNYVSPTYEDRQKRLHQVVPIRIQYQSGHWYLRAHRLLRRDSSGKEDRQERHLKYRLSYIQDDEKLVISATIMPSPPEAEKYYVHYRLLPPLSRGIISEHFYDMKITGLDDGSVEITGYCDDAWEAGRLLLSYGEYCVVLGGDEVKAWMEKTIASLIKNYQYLGK
ncbi:MAG TPA: WYL domain-containing protein, partial [Anaerolineales bacterium]|nr:WYL domain-containing protein [Anaerolineales bacterium]